MESLTLDDIFDSIISIKALIKATTLGIVLIEFKLIRDQREQIDNLNTIFEDVGDLLKEIQVREDMPTDIKHKIDSLSYNQSKRGE